MMLVLAECGLAGATAPTMPVITLHVGGVPFTAEVALTEDQQEHGLMARESLAPDAGMLFPLPVDHAACVWMKNTALPLSVAFVEGAGRIVNVLELAPNDLTPRCARSAARYILEAPSGWFSRHKVGEGDPVTGLPGVDLAR